MTNEERMKRDEAARERVARESIDVNWYERINRRVTQALIAVNVIGALCAAVGIVTNCCPTLNMVACIGNLALVAFNVWDLRTGGDQQ